MSCIYCGKQILNKGSLKSHEIRCKLNPDRVVLAPFKGKVPWNKGLTKDTSPIIAEQARKVSQTTTGRKGRPHTKESRELMSRLAKERGLGSKTNKPGWGKKGWYNGIWCDSSWELALVLYCINNSMPIERAKIELSYEHEGKVKSYFPDFLVNGVLTEVKGRPDERWEYKKLYNPDVDVYDEDRMSPILSWVREKFGRDFTNLYDGAIKEERTPGRTRGYNALTPEEVEERLKKIEKIDLTKFGWVRKVSEILGISHTHARRFMDKHYQGKTYKRGKVNTEGPLD